MLMETLSVRRTNSDTIALWTQHITDCKNSGKHTQEWCKENGINVKTYYYWHNKIHKLVVQQQASFFEVPRQPAGEPERPAATIRTNDLQADIYPGATDELIQARLPDRRAHPRRTCGGVSSGVGSRT